MLWVITRKRTRARMPRVLNVALNESKSIRAGIWRGGGGRCKFWAQTMRAANEKIKQTLLLLLSSRYEEEAPRDRPGSGSWAERFSQHKMQNAGWKLGGCTHTRHFWLHPFMVLLKVSYSIYSQLLNQNITFSTLSTCIVLMVKVFDSSCSKIFTMCLRD